MRNPISLSTITVVLTASALSVSAADWAQYRGPNHDGVSTEKFPTKWPEAGLRQLWKSPLNAGFSSFTVAKGKAFTLVTREVDGTASEVCVALDSDTGKEVWATPLGLAKYDGGGDSGAQGNNGGDGPRSTPSFDDGKVYTYSSRMVVKCMNAADGKEIWACDVLKDHAGKNIHWESAASPLIEGDLVYVVGGGAGESLLALDKKDGHVVWKGQDDGMTHSTPVAATILGERQIVFFTQKGLVSVVPKTGDVLWRFAFNAGRGAAAASPVVSGDMVYLSMSYGVGTSVCKVSKTGDGWSTTQLWNSPGNKQSSHWTTPVCYNGCLYGIFDQAKFATAPLKCIDMATGAEKWSQDGFGPGGITLVDGGNLLVLSDAGDLVLIKAAPDAYSEITRSHVLNGKCWSSVAISNGRLYARSTKEGVSLDISSN